MGVFDPEQAPLTAPNLTPHCARVGTAFFTLYGNLSLSPLANVLIGLFKNCSMLAFPDSSSESRLTGSDGETGVSPSPS